MNGRFSRDGFREGEDRCCDRCSNRNERGRGETIEVRCPTLPTDLTLDSLTVQGPILSHSLDTGKATILDLHSTTASITTLEVTEETLKGNFTRTDSGVMANSVEEMINSYTLPVQALALPPAPITAFNSLPFGPFPGFFGGVMTLSGQSGILAITVTVQDEFFPGGPFYLFILRSGLIEGALYEENPFGTLSATFPVTSMDTSVVIGGNTDTVGIVKNLLITVCSI